MSELEPRTPSRKAAGDTHSPTPAPPQIAPRQPDRPTATAPRTPADDPAKLRDSSFEAGRLSTQLHEYDALRAEILVQLGFYKAHVRNFQIMIGAVLVVVGFALANRSGTAGPPESVSLIPVAANWALWWGIAVAIPVATGYMVLDITESLYSVALISSHLALVEKELNEAVGGNPLTWESSVSPRFWRALFPAFAILNPNWLLGLLQTALFLGVNLALPGWIFRQLLDANATLHSPALPRFVVGGRYFTWIVTGLVVLVAIWVAVIDRQRIATFLRTNRDAEGAHAETG